jgi:hypothetical protein
MPSKSAHKFHSTIKPSCFISPTTTLLSETIISFPFGFPPFRPNDLNGKRSEEMSSNREMQEKLECRKNSYQPSRYIENRRKDPELRRGTGSPSLEPDQTDENGDSHKLDEILSRSNSKMSEG